MADSPRKQMEKVLAFKRKGGTMKECAQYVLDHEDWLPLLTNRQAYFRDFVLQMVKYRISLGIDDTLIPSIIKGMVNTGYMWDVFNRVKNTDRVAYAVITAALAIQNSGNEFSAETFTPVFRLIAEPVTNKGKVPFCLAEDNETMHPLVVEALLSDPEAVERLIVMCNARIKDPLLALSALRDDLSAPLLSGAL